MADKWTFPFKTLWVLYDKDNGHSGSHRYCWCFPTKKLAQAYKEWQNSNPKFAELVGPYRYKGKNND